MESSWAGVSNEKSLPITRRQVQSKSTPSPPFTPVTWLILQGHLISACKKHFLDLHISLDGNNFTFYSQVYNISAQIVPSVLYVPFVLSVCTLPHHIYGEGHTYAYYTAISTL